MGVSQACIALNALLLVFVLCTVVQVALGGNCTSIAARTIERANTRFTITGRTIEINPKSSGVVYTKAGLRWDLSLMVERAKVNTTWWGQNRSPEQHFIQPIANFPSVVDPLEPYVPTRGCTSPTPEDLPCRPILRYIYLDEMDCWAEQETKLYYGFERESIYVYFTHPSFPNFRLTAEHHVLNDTLVIPRALNNSALTSYESYQPNTLKLSYIWENFPWVGGDDITYGTLHNSLGSFNYNNASAMSFWANFTATVPFPCSVTMDRDGLGYNATIRGLDVPLVLSLSVTTVYTADDNYTWLNLAGNRTYTNLTYNMTEPSVTFLQSSSATDNGVVGHWKKLSYDPNMGALFSAPVDFGGPSTTPQTAAKNKNVGKLPVYGAVLIAIAVVAILVTAIVLTVIHVPAAKALIRPFTQRGVAGAGGNVGSTTSKEGWQRASSPSRAITNQ